MPEIPVLSAEAYAAILDRTTDSVLSVDRNGRIVYVNARYAHRLGTTPDALCGRDIWAVFPELVGTIFQQQYDLAMATQQPVTFEVEYPPLDSWLEVRGFPGPDGLTVYFRDTTERRCLESALRESEETARAFVNAVPDAAILLDRDGIVLSANPTACMRMGVTQDELIGRDGYAAPLPPSRAAIRRQRNAEAMRSGKRACFEEAHGDELYEHTLVPVKDAHGRATRLAIFSRDITTQRQAAQALRDRTAFLELVTESIPQYVFWKDRDSVYQGCNTLFAHAVGLAGPAEIVGKTDDELEWKCGRVEDIQDHDQRVMLTGIAEMHVEETRTCADGHTVVLNVNKVPIRNARGEIVGVLGMYEDITERKQTTESLRDNAQRLNSLLEHTPVAVVEWDADFIVTRWTGEAEALFGWSAAETVGKPVYDLHMIYEPDIPLVEAIIARLTDGVSRQVISENRNVTKDGRVLHCTWYNSVLLDEQGQMASVFSLVLNDTARITAEAALERERALLDAAIDVLPLPLAFLNREMEVVRVNDAARRWTAALGAVPVTETELLDPLTRKPITAAHIPGQRALRGEIIDGEEFLLHAPATEQDIPCQFFAAPVVIDGKIVAAVTLIQDISLLKAIDHAKDEFLAVLSHELLTPLTSVLGWSEIAQERDTLEVYRQAMPLVHRNAVRQHARLNELLDMSRLLEGRLAWEADTVDLGSLVCDTVDAAITAAEHAGVNVILEPIICDLPVRVDRAQLRKAIDHLLSNSIRYTPNGGQITVACRVEGEQAVLSVADTGRGISPEAMPHLWTPFRQVDRDEAAGGLGLGLAITRGIADLAGGTVGAESAGVNQGSRFTLRLPRLASVGEQLSFRLDDGERITGHGAHSDH